MKESKSYQQLKLRSTKKDWVVIIIVALCVHIAFFLFFKPQYLRIFRTEITGDEGESAFPVIDRPFSVVDLPDEPNKQASPERVVTSEEAETREINIDALGEPPAELMPIEGSSRAGSDGRPGPRRTTVDPKPLYIPWPQYPDGIEKPVEGNVELMLFVDGNGEVQDVRVTRGLPQAILNEIAVAAAWDIRFIPGMKQGVPTAMWIRLTIGFQPR